MVDILYAKATRCKETHGDKRTSNQCSHSTTVGAEINSAKKDLPELYLNDYSGSVAPHWATGRSNPCNTKATIDAESVFFVVYTNVSASFYLAADARIESMVAQAGQSSDWPVSFVAGIATPVWATTHERSNSGGSNIRYTKEVDAMSSAPTPTRLKFTDTYWVIPLHSETPYGKVSFTRQEARLFRVMFKDSRLIWAGRQPVHESVEEISIPQGGVNIAPPSTITEIVTVQGVAHV